MNIVMCTDVEIDHEETAGEAADKSYRPLLYHLEREG